MARGRKPNASKAPRPGIPELEQEYVLGDTLTPEDKDNDEHLVKMVFTEDKFVDGKPFAKKNEPVEVKKSSVHRWLKRGGMMFVDGEAKSTIVEKQLDAGLAAELEKQGVADQEETDAALQQVEL